MRKAYQALFLSAPVFFLLTAFLPVDAEAVPAFARRIGRNCSYCHTVFPELNETGHIFKANGLRFADEGEWQDARDWKTFPIAAEVEIEGVYNDVKSSGVSSHSSDMKVEEVEVFAGGPMGKTGRITAFGIFAVEQDDDGGSTTYDSKIPHAFIQINDLVGPQGAGRLNLKVGQDTLALPFVGGSQKFINKRHLAEDALGLFSDEQRLVELNGQYLFEDEKKVVSHRYSAGVSREDVNDEDKLRGFFATYACNLNETYSLGAMYRNGEERSGATDASYNKYGIAAEAEFEIVVVTAGWFRAERSGLDDQDNFLLEAAYIPNSKWSLAARYDVVDEEGKETASAYSFMVRYNILSNVYAMLEYRGLDDDDHVTSSNEEEGNLRAFFVALF
ncbi:MAG TPA: porin [Thermodesulfobacteriota bacterium]|nr:porin [Thermodesulfobacteriota bacterium]